MWCGPGLALPGVTRSRHQCGLSQWPHALSQGWGAVISTTVITLSVIITRGEHCMDILRWASSASSESPNCPLDVGDEVPRAGSCLSLSVLWWAPAPVWCDVSRPGADTGHREMSVGDQPPETTHTASRQQHQASDSSEAIKHRVLGDKAPRLLSVSGVRLYPGGCPHCPHCPHVTRSWRLATKTSPMFRDFLRRDNW